MNKKKQRAHFRMADYVRPPYNVHGGFFHSYLQEMKKNQPSILKWSYVFR